MSFRPCMTSFTSRIKPAMPLVTRSWQGAVADLWTVDIGAGASGRYVARDPRFVIVLDPASAPMDLTCEDGTSETSVAIAYIPAGVSAESRFCQRGALCHLDLHFDQRILTQCFSGLNKQDLEALQRPLLLSGNPPARAIALLIAAELRAGAASDLVISSLATAFVCKVLHHAGSAEARAPQRGGLSPAQMQKVTALMRGRMHDRLTVADMAAHVGLSESWFAHAYRQSCGDTPYRALQSMRVRLAQTLLQEGRTIADIAASAGFADQAHLTRAFRSLTGQTPGTWRRNMLLQQDCTIPDSFTQD